MGSTSRHTGALSSFTVLTEVVTVMMRFELESTPSLTSVTS